MHRFTFDAIGTQWQIDSLTAVDPALQQRLLQRAEAFDAVYSRFCQDTLISRMAAATTCGRFQFPDDGEPLFLLDDRLHRVACPLP